MSESADHTNAPSLSPDSIELWQSLFAAVKQEAIAARVHELLMELQTRVNTRGPVCWSSGKCCNFDAYGHRMYATGLEIAWMLTRISSLPNAASHQAEIPTRVDLKGSCPFQADSLCSVHAIRPMGCRIFFCQKGTEKWQHELYEIFLTRLRTLHQEFSLPYRYMEWRAGLDEAMRVKSKI